MTFFFTLSRDTASLTYYQDGSHSANGLDTEFEALQIFLKELSYVDKLYFAKIYISQTSSPIQLQEMDSTMLEGVFKGNTDTHAD